MFSLYYSLFGSLMKVSILLTGYLLGIAAPQIVGLGFGIISVLVSLSWLILTNNKTNKNKIDSQNQSINL